ncbi:MAG: cytochrome c biogenesis protein CcsA [candidate division Zixibacteria bacterium]|nr:cytochrome c biogenesis protein CcsA [candidate division Zixibacteria bacterium]
MNVGDTLLYLAAILSIATFALGVSRSPGLARWLKPAYVATTACLTLAFVYLLYAFLAHRFEFSYVASYSSRDLPLGYLVSSLWAGQEGTFLLWAFLGSILGLFLLRSNGPLTRWVIAYFMITQFFLVLLLLVRSPFAMSLDIPPDGRGLNPLLQDPWMVIHPPIVFLGYAALAIPFAYALAALTTRKFDEFTAQVFPWVGFSVMSLGAGIFIGAFWAYEVLGWGGYWGWDPVENSSLIPWLTALAMLHGLILFRMQPKLLKTNIGLALVSYLLVVYGTFLTRSGVLADFSVHSFTDLGINGYLIVYMIGATILSMVALITRTRGVPTVPISRAVNSREFGLVFGLLLLVMTSALVLIGTSAPLLTKIGGQPANVAMSYYNMISIPMGIFIALTLTISPFLIFGLTPWRELYRNVFPSLMCAIGVAVVAIFLGVVDVFHLLIVVGATGALVSNLIALIRFSEWKLPRMAGHMTHFGFAIMLLGILGSSGYSVSKRLSLEPSQPQEAFGYDVTFNRKVEGHRETEGYFDLTLAKGSTTIGARPKLYYSDYTNSEMRNPHIVTGLIQDIYLAPMDFREGEAGNFVELVKGTSKTVGDWTLTFRRFAMDSHDTTGAMTVSVEIGAARGTDTLTIMPSMASGAAGMTPVPAQIPGTEIQVSLAGMKVESQTIRLAVDNPHKPMGGSGGVLTIDLATKPLVSLVWAGVIIITFGSLLSFWRRWREAEIS